MTRYAALLMPLYCLITACGESAGPVSAQAPPPATVPDNGGVPVVEGMNGMDMLAPTATDEPPGPDLPDDGLPTDMPVNDVPPTDMPVDDAPPTDMPEDPPPDIMTEMPRPAVRVPNVEYPPELQDEGVNQEDPYHTLEEKHHNQPMMRDGYLFLGGNAEHSIWDIQDPSNPVKVADLVSQHNAGEAESHQVVFAHYPATGMWYAATTSGRGVDIWDVTDMTDPSHVSHVDIDGINYGDVAGGVWGKAWQGKYLYIGGNDTGLHVVDVEDPENPSVVKTLPNGETGSFFPGPLFAMGNILVITSPKDKGGVATMDISNPTDPILLDSLVPSSSYIGWYYGGHVFLQGPLRNWDVLSDPTNIQSGMSNMNTPASEYMSFGDDQLFLGLLRPNPGVIRFDVSDLSAPQMQEKIEGRYLYLDNGDQHQNDDQFSLKVGNLLILSDDEQVGTVNAGTWIVVENVQPDTKPPVVKNVWPTDGMSVLSTSSIGFSFSDQIEPATVGAPSLIVRPIGGEPVAGRFGFMRTVVNFQPNEPLPPGDYEVVLPVDGICDLGGNPIAEEFKSTFTVL